MCHKPVLRSGLELGSRSSSGLLLCRPQATLHPSFWLSGRFTPSSRSRVFLLSTQRVPSLLLVHTLTLTHAHSHAHTHTHTHTPLAALACCLVAACPVSEPLSTARPKRFLAPCRPCPPGPLLCAPRAPLSPHGTHLNAQRGPNSVPRIVSPPRRLEGRESYLILPCISL